MNSVKYILFLLLPLWGMASCIEPFEAEISSSEATRLVVEGNIVSDRVSKFTISSSIDLDDERLSVNYITNATVAVKGTDGSIFYGTRNYGDPFYQVSVGTLNPSVSYYLSIIWEGHTYQSEPLKPLYVPDIKQMRFQQVREDQLVDVLLSTNQPVDTTTFYLKMNYEEYWEIYTPIRTNGYYDPVYDDCFLMDEANGERMDHGFCHHQNDKPVIIDPNQFNNNELTDYQVYTIDCSDDRLQTLYYTKVELEAIGKDEYEYENLRGKLTDEMGGLFSPQPSELPTNMVCTDGDVKVIGYVGVRGNVSSSELFIPRNSVNYVSRHKACHDIDEEMEEKYTPFQLYCYGYRVSSYNVVDPMSGARKPTWCPRWGVDCTDPTWGATRHRPSFWPGKASYYEETGNWHFPQ